MNDLRLGDVETRFVSACCDADVVTPSIGMFMCERCGRELEITERPIAGLPHLSWLRYGIEDSDRATAWFDAITLAPCGPPRIG